MLSKRVLAALIDPWGIIYPPFTGYPVSIKSPLSIARKKYLSWAESINNRGPDNAPDVNNQTTHTMNHRPKWLLATLVFAVFSGSSLWFSGNAIVNALLLALPETRFDISNMTSAVQLGFILGTLVFSLSNVTDRFPTGRVFLVSSVLASLSNAIILIVPLTDNSLLISRCLTGFFLAGIYPVGVKIAATWYPQNLGRALGYIVGALVAGTAFPHLVNYLNFSFNWQWVIFCASALALCGGLSVVLFIPETTHNKRSQQHEGSALLNIFKSKDFKASSFGYFGHMWELYTFWAFVPLILLYYSTQTANVLNVSLWSFLIIASGALGCILGGIVSLKQGSARVAFYQLATSAACCLFFPLMINAPAPIFIIYLLVWGMTVAGDSPQFSTLNAKTAPADAVGSAITLVICLGFALTIVSLQVFNALISHFNLQIAVILLAIGPIYGLTALRQLMKKLPIQLNE